LFLSSGKYDPGCSSRITDPGSYFLLILAPGVKKALDPDLHHCPKWNNLIAFGRCPFFYILFDPGIRDGLKYENFLMQMLDPGKLGSGTRDGKNRIRDKHPESVTLIILLIFFSWEMVRSLVTPHMERRQSHR
jgi:hypothetical protein